MVTSSNWMDFDNDGWDDLVIVGEWMPIKFFKNDKGTFKDVSAQLLPQKSSGWWFNIQNGDFDNDGDLDYGRWKFRKKL